MKICYIFEYLSNENRFFFLGGGGGGGTPGIEVIEIHSILLHTTDRFCHILES